ncbi:nucleoid-associated protein [Empedobacter brevis]|uniref:nucleoid-associated protein n=1 Tax=Empedobacter brevis TaxID=247 RepID=UPI0028D00112|nr:nucleoid-associated protein [Empedobacter brevis]
MNEVSNISINRYIIHYIEKEPKKTESTLELSKEILLEDEFSKKLISEIHSNISINPSLKNTKFDYPKSTYFSTEIEEYVNNADDNNFIKFTNTISKLNNRIEKIPLATGGYYLFVDYTVKSKNYIGVILLRKKDSINIIKENGVFKLGDSESINIEKIGIAFRLNVEIFKNKNINDLNYIALITSQADGNISGYFKEWINSQIIIQGKENTSNLVLIVNSIPMPVTKEGEHIFKDRIAFKKAIYDYQKSKKSKSINLLDLSKHFYGDSDYIINFASNNKIIIDNEFMKHQDSWRKLIHIDAKIDGVEIRLDQKVLNNIVVIEENRIIIKSRKLIDQINRQIS